MIEPEPGRKALTAWQMLKPDLDWSRVSISLKAIIGGLVVLGVAGALFVVAGGVNVSADRPDNWVTAHLLHYVFKRSEATRSSTVIPPRDLADPNRVRLGAQHFDMVCANCHGRPGFGQSVTALSMNPKPQYLPQVVGEFTDQELYLIVEHGVSYSAMPAWPTAERGDEVWSMVAFLRQLPKLDANAYRELTALPETPATATTGSGGDSSLRPANLDRNDEWPHESLFAAPAAGFADRSIHDHPIATCARCHGADGSGAATGGEAPNLTIQDAHYLRASLQAYTSGARKSGFMQNIAAELSTTQINALADYYASQPIQSAAAPQQDPALVKRGEAIATEGIRERAIPACVNCHESSGSAVIGAPHIAGQQATYLRHELAALRLGGRGSTVGWNPMPAEAHDLSDTDIAALAAYYSGLKPAKTTGGAQAAQQQVAAAAPANAASSDINPGAKPDSTKADLAMAKQLFETRCTKCHANEGRGDAEGGFPDLTLQTTPYVAQTLYSFRTRARPNEKMIEVIDDLSFDQMTSLANYVNSLAPEPALARPNADAAARGASIAMHGISDRGVPACLGCHDAKSITALPLIPRLQGQSPVYLQRRLDNFAKGYDVNTSALNPMPSIAGQLTNQERADLAAYFAAAAPLQKTAARQ